MGQWICIHCLYFPQRFVIYFQLGSHLYGVSVVLTLAFTSQKRRQMHPLLFHGQLPVQSPAPVSLVGFALSSSWHVWEPISHLTWPHHTVNQWRVSTFSDWENKVHWQFGRVCLSFNLQWV